MQLVRHEKLTKVSIFVIIPKCEVLFDRLMPVERACMSGTTRKCIGCGKYVLAALSFAVSSSRNVHWMPVELTHAIVGVPMESPDHKTKSKVLRSWPYSTIT